VKIIILTLCLCLLSGCVAEDPANDDPVDEEPVDEEPVDEEPERVVIEIPNANEIIETFDNNELDGNKKYFGKWIKTTAYFDEIDKSWLNDLWVVMYARKDNGFKSSYGIVCEKLSKTEKTKVSEFDEDQPITFIGKNDGLSGGAYVFFEECEFIDD